MSLSQCDQASLVNVKFLDAKSRPLNCFRCRGMRIEKLDINNVQLIESNVVRFSGCSNMKIGDITVSNVTGFGSNLVPVHFAECSKVKISGKIAVQRVALSGLSDDNDDMRCLTILVGVLFQDSRKIQMKESAGIQVSRGGYLAGVQDNDLLSQSGAIAVQLWNVHDSDMRNVQVQDFYSNGDIAGGYVVEGGSSNVHTSNIEISRVKNQDLTGTLGTKSVGLSTCLVTDACKTKKVSNISFDHVFINQVDNVSGIAWGVEIDHSEHTHLHKAQIQNVFKAIRHGRCQSTKVSEITCIDCESQS